MFFFQKSGYDIIGKKLISGGQSLIPVGEQHGKIPSSRAIALSRIDQWVNLNGNHLMKRKLNRTQTLVSSADGSRSEQSVEYLYQRSITQVLFMITFLCTTLVGCMHQISVQSEPSGADVWLLNARGPQRILLGKTPLSGKSLSPTGAAVLEVEKQGFLAKQIAMVLLPGANLSIATRLQPVTADYLSEKSRRDFTETLSKISTEMSKLQTVIGTRIPEILGLQALIIERKKEEVLQQEKKMKDAWTAVSSFHMLMGDFFVSEGNTSEARIRFQRALKIDPQNAELKKKIQSLSGVPASKASSPTPISAPPQDAAGNTKTQDPAEGAK
ncbi:hypothetical protein EBU99_11975 [bacterium]|nr:hypothetical protein [bacterium]